MNDIFIRVCKNGHQIPEYNNFCQKCGSPVLNRCNNCGTRIKPIRSDLFLAPDYCDYCGQPFPWVEAALQAAAELLAEDENITAEECNRLIAVLPDAMCETPKSKLAAARIRKALSVLGSFTADALRQILLDHACDLVKQQLGL